MEDKILMSIKVDVNDADYVYLKFYVDTNDIKNIKLMSSAIARFKPYDGKPRYDGSKRKHRNNFPNGGMYGFNMYRDDLGGKSPYTYYVESKMVSEDVFNTFKKYIKNRTFHTIHKIKLNKEIIFNKKNDY
jgi:hypothetical protein